MWKIKKEVLLFILFQLSYFVTLAQNYNWDNVVVGGGGYVTGIQIHPSEAGLMYMRTDIGGLFRWDNANDRWIALFGWIDPNNDNLYGVDGFALDKNNPDIVYACLGKYPTTQGGIFKSYDRGVTWEKLRDGIFASNMKYREVGENMAVDPNNSNIIYCGTRTEGLLKSTDGGQNWFTVTGVPWGYTGVPSNYWPKDNNPLGIRNVVIDGNSQHSSGNSTNVYVTVYGEGVYRSSDGGNSFYKMNGSPSNVYRTAVAPNNVIYVTADDGVYKYNGGWQQLPINPGGYNSFNGISVDPNNPNNIITSTGVELWWQRQYISNDAGATWKELYAFNGTMEVHDRTWHSIDLGFFQAATAAIIFDPHKPGRVYSTDWYQVWRCENVWETPSHWYNDVKGHEEIVVLAICTPHQGTPLFSGQGDVVGFKHTDQKELPLKRLTDQAECTGLDYCENDYTKMALVSASDWYGLNTSIYTSNDAGDNFTEVSTPEGALNGKIAIASNDPNKMVFVYGDSEPYYTTDGGNSWQKSTGGPTRALTTTYMYQYDDPLQADRTAANTFYLLDRENGKLYKSTNGGQSWFVSHSGNLPATSNYANFAAAWGSNNNLMGVSMWTDGLWLSNNSGSSFYKIDYFSNARMFSFGKEKPGSSTPSLYVYGVHNNQWGIYQSNDFGSTWNRINDNQNYIGNSPTMMKADRQTYGKIYVGTNGSGLFYGEISGEDPNPTQSPYNGSAFQIPGKIPAAEYDFGGQNVAYYDKSSGNAGGAFRDDDVDIGYNNQGGYDIGWIEDGEWLEYSVNITQSGNYKVTTTVASQVSGTKSFELNVNNQTINFSFDDDSGWQSYVDITSEEVYLNSGNYIMRFKANSYSFNVHEFDFVLSTGGGNECSQNLLNNPGFESGDFTSWSGWNNSIETNTGHLYSGNYGAGAWWNGAIEQTVYGLDPNTQYYVTVWAKNLESGKNGSINVDGHGGSTVSTTINSTSFAQYTVAFTTGSNNTSAKIQMRAPAEGMSVVDDFWLGCGASNARITSVIDLEHQLKIVSNPSLNYIEIVNFESTQADVMVYDINGHQLERFKVENTPRFSFDINGYAPGMYILLIKEDDQLTRRKFIKE
ncbi:carbohydrate-binding protein [Flammeovirga yaeyamensis]|uniref:Carbohydrate-binding protein n=1 Tax=Flammeovirga yaeyamensis TaxID=367791 RepID=A0AAX1NC36_9BACT|nr:carbohydrate-binding protein [Flammeovirga yaeyamensis]MBB3697814.1 hypothetical protein [Flammeovirga yaeyamensis]NMF35830.1 carbohydrate-binding protein [Flammeovirga yaeyamensis]QWG03218.1 carbohydrate-binding protein [Flammeovirga yaeyamensis]